MRTVSFNGKSSMDFDYKYLIYTLGNLEVENITDDIEGNIVHYDSYKKPRKLTITLCIKNPDRSIRE